MNRDLIFATGAFVSLLVATGGTARLASLLPGNSAVVAPAVAPDTGPSIDVSAAFAVNTDAASRQHDEHVVSGMLDGVANAIELDGKRTSPKFTYVQQAFDLRDAAISYAFSDQTMGSKYPGFWPGVKDRFGAFSDGTKPLDAASRAALVDLFRQLARGSRKAG